MDQVAPTRARRLRHPADKEWLPREVRRNLWIYIVLIPPFAMFTIFTLIPIARSLLLSFQTWTLKQTTWSGLTNFRQLVSDPVFFKALKNTFLYTLAVVPISTAIALSLSAFIFRLPSAAQTFFKSAFYLPAVVAAVVVVLVWRWIYNPNEYGLLNYLLSLAGKEPVLWLQKSRSALPALTATSLVGGGGGAVVLLLSAMGGIPITLYECARLDGSNRRQEFWYITLPLLKPSILYLTVMGTIGSFQVFTGILLLTQGGPNYATTTTVFQIYKTAFQHFEFGYASAQAVVLFLIIMAFSFFLFRILASEVEF